MTLKRHGGWKTSTVAEGYIEESIDNKISVTKKNRWRGWKDDPDPEFYSGSILPKSIVPSFNHECALSALVLKIKNIDNAK